MASQENGAASAASRLASRTSRRALLAGAAALLPAVGWVRGAAAQSDQRLTRAGRWVEASEVGVARAEAIGDIVPEPIAFQTPYRVFAAAPHWSGKEKPGATLEVSFSADGATWSAPVTVGEDGDNGRPGKDNRRYGPLLMTGPAEWIRYRSHNAAGRPAALRGLAWEYIDASNGAGSLETAQRRKRDRDRVRDASGAGAIAPPDIISRAEWGADESLRLVNGRWEIWPAEYADVRHLVIHHSDTANWEDPLVTIRSIYHYHAVTKGWGDIGYNYLVDYLGNVYEGRVGGEGAVGGHALGYNAGTCGICTMGRYSGEDPTPDLMDGLAGIAAWAARNLDPAGQAAFGDIVSLPTIAAHRDVNPTACPGERLYADLTWLRESVQRIHASWTEVAAADAAAAAQFAAGEPVTTITEGVALREGPGFGHAVIARLAAAEPLTVLDGPADGDGLAWYRVTGTSQSGWTAADYLDRLQLPDEGEMAIGGMTSDAGAEGIVAAQSLAIPPGATVEIVETDLNLRDAPAGGVLRTLAQGAWLSVTGAPQTVDGTSWYPVDTGDGATGWVSGEYLRRR